MLHHEAPRKHTTGRARPGKTRDHSRSGGKTQPCAKQAAAQHLAGRGAQHTGQTTATDAGTPVRPQAGETYRCCLRTGPSSIHEHANLMNTEKSSLDERDPNVGFHPPAENDAPAAWSMLVIIVVVVAVCLVAAAIAYNYYNDEPVAPPAKEQVMPPVAP